MAESQLGIIDGQQRMEWSEGLWDFDESDWALMAMLQDPIHCAELLWEDPNNRDYDGCYHVIDYQYPLFRPPTNEAGFPCARSVGKTESMKAQAVSHAFRRQRQDMLITAPQLIHLDPLCAAIEERISKTRLTREMLDMRSGKTGFTHKPFQVDFADGTKIIGRIPHRDGTGVKGQHVVDLRVEEGQDYPEPGWTEVAPTLMRDYTDKDGNPDFTFCFYGVHVPSREGTFYKSTQSGEFDVTTITAIMRPGWGPDEKRRWAAIYGGTTSADYRRNILGEAGSGAAAFFVTSRLFACIDQNKDSKYNTVEWKRQALRAEEIDKMVPSNDPDHTVGHLLDLPGGLGQQVFLGADIGLVNDPTVLLLWAVLPDTHKKLRLKLVRMFHLWQFREKQIRQCMYAVALKYGQTLRGVGLDVTGLGLPLFQAMEDDEFAPKHLLEVAQGYVFNAKLPIGVDKSFTSEDTAGNIRDQFGNIVEKVEDPFTRQVKYVVKMTMIEASTRYLREWVDTGFLWMPFDPEVAGDFQGESEQRVKAMAGTAGRKKVNAFHILDAARAMAMVKMHADVMEQVQVKAPVAVQDRAVDIAGSLTVQGGMDAGMYDGGYQ